MIKVSNQQTQIAIAAFLGAVAGGVIVAFTTKAIPKMMSEMMQGMMANMMTQIKECGCSPEMCQKMMASKSQT